MSIQTTRLSLQPLATHHADVIWAMRRLKEIYIWTYAGEWKSPDDSVQWVDRMLQAEDVTNFVVTIDRNGDLARSMDLSTIPSLDDGSLAIGSLGITSEREMGYLVHPSAWGKGVATEAVTAMIKYWFTKNENKDKELLAQVDVENTGSMKLMEKLGFTITKRQAYESIELGSRFQVHFIIDKQAVDRLK